LPTHLKNYLTDISQACSSNICELYFLQTPLQTAKFIKYCGSEVLNICALHIYNERVEEFKYLGTLTNQNSIQVEIKRRLTLSVPS
jgi:thymidylate synthase